MGLPGVVVDASLESPEESARIQREVMLAAGAGEVMNTRTNTLAAEAIIRTSAKRHQK